MHINHRSAPAAQSPVQNHQSSVSGSSSSSVSHVAQPSAEGGSGSTLSSQGISSPVLLPSSMPQRDSRAAAVAEEVDGSNLSSATTAESSEA